MAKVYSWQISTSPKKYAYIVHPQDFTKPYIGSAELSGTNLEKVKNWAAICTDTEYEEQFDKLVALCASKNLNVEFEAVSAYINVDSSCDNLRGPAGRGIERISLYSTDSVRNVSTYVIYYNDGTTDTFEVKNGKDGKDGIDGSPGAKGDSGVSSKFIMIYTSGVDSNGNTFTPSRPIGGSYDFTTNSMTYPNGWASNDSEITPPVWMSTRTFSSSEASTDSEWSLPIQITGENGKPGVDGVSTEFIYYLDENQPSVENLSSPNQAGYEPPIETGWTPSPQGVSETNTTEWCSVRKLNRETNEWGKWETPFIWSKYGVNGQDGDGVQYIYLKNKGNVPENPTPYDYLTNDNYQNRDNEWVPTEGVTYINKDGKSITFSPIETLPEGSTVTPAGVWSDNPSDVTSEFHSQWVCSRKYKKNSEGKMSWGSYSDPALWAKFGQDGKNATSVRKLYALSDSTSNPPDVPNDSVITGVWGTGFPIDYQVGVNVVWGTEAEIWAHNFEFVKTYKIVSGRDADNNIIPPTDYIGNFIDVKEIPNEKVENYKYIRFNDEYYEWLGGWCSPYLVTGLKGENGNPIDYTSYLFGFGYTDYVPNKPAGTNINNPISTDEAGNTIIWLDFPNTSNGRVDGFIDANGNEMRWYQCIAHIDGRKGVVKEWGDVQPCNGRDGFEGVQGYRTEIRFAITNNTQKPDLIEQDSHGNIYREPILLDENHKQVGWFATDEDLPEIPVGGAMWQIWALIDDTNNKVVISNNKAWNGPRRVSGEKGDQGVQGPAGMRGVTGIPGAKSIQMYCLGTYGKNNASEHYFDTYSDVSLTKMGDGYFGSKNFNTGDMTDWYSGQEMPYSDIIDVTTLELAKENAKKNENRGRVIRLINVSNVTSGTSSFENITHTYFLVTNDNNLKQLTKDLNASESEEFNVYVWCIQGNEVWKAGPVKKYVDVTKYENNIATRPSDSNDANTIIVTSIPTEKNELFKYLCCNGLYYEWKEIDGDKVEHVLEKIEWGSPFKLQGTNGLRGLSGSRGQVVYPMGVYNSEEVYITTEDKAPYVYDPNDGMYYVYNIVDKPWVGRLPGYNPDTGRYDESHKTIKKNDGTFKYSIDGSGNEGTWMTDQEGDSPANNYANATNSFNKPAWVRFESFQALYTSIGIIENGMIGSAVYNNEFMFSQQGYKQDGITPTTYAVILGSDTQYGFLSGYEYDANGDANGRHWKYKGTNNYINNINVDPYEKQNGKFIHSFLPNVCINFSTGQMWLSTGQIKFGGLNERNISTTEEINETFTNFEVSLDGITGRVEKLNDSYSEVSQTVDSINSTVGNMENEFSTIKQTVDNLTSTVVSLGGENLLDRTEFETIAAMTDRNNSDSRHFNYQVRNVVNSKVYINQYDELSNSILIDAKEGTSTADRENYVDISQDLGQKLKSNTTYTLHCKYKQKYIPHDKNNVYSSGLLYITNSNPTWMVVDGKTITSRPSDLATKFDTTINDQWQKMVIKFTTGNLEKEPIFFFRTMIGSEVELVKLKLEEGTTPTAWSKSQKDITSTIKQTADNISLEIKNGLESTGIHIDEHYITLDGTTKIIGNLNIYDSDTGIVVFNEDNNPAVQIKKGSIGDIDGLKSSTNVLPNKQRIYENVTPNTTETLNVETIRLGKYNEGETIMIEQLGLFLFMTYNIGTEQKYYNPYYTATVKVVMLNQYGVPTSTPLFNQTFTNCLDTKLITNNNIKIDTTGDYALVITMTATTGNESSYNISYGTYSVLITRIVSNSILIGYDGISASFDDGSLFFVNKETLQLRRNADDASQVKGLIIGDYATPMKLCARTLAVNDIEALDRLGPISSQYNIRSLSFMNDFYPNYKTCNAFSTLNWTSRKYDGSTWVTGTSKHNYVYDLKIDDEVLVYTTAYIGTSNAAATPYIRLIKDVYEDKLTSNVYKGRKVKIVNLSTAPLNVCSFKFLGYAGDIISSHMVNSNYYKTIRYKETTLYSSYFKTSFVFTDKLTIASGNTVEFIYLGDGVWETDCNQFSVYYDNTEN